MQETKGKTHQHYFKEDCVKLERCIIKRVRNSLISFVTDHTCMLSNNSRVIALMENCTSSIYCVFIFQGNKPCNFQEHNYMYLHLLYGALTADRKEAFLTGFWPSPSPWSTLSVWLLWATN